MTAPLIISFPGRATQAVTPQVGGKAASLIRMSGAGLPVPPGVVFTTAFFAPWFDRIRASATWARLLGAPAGDWIALCGELKRNSLTLPLSPAQREALEAFLRVPAGAGHGARLAVRSSSPDEDQKSASFAGLYQTRLGVRPGNLESALRDCFASAFDVRVFSYKTMRGIDVWSPSFAAIVQQQLDSDIAGVGFSLDPVTNDYDEVVINANWGLGVSVVEGRTSPDHFVVNKTTRKVVQERRGGKHLMIQLDPGGGTVERRNDRPRERVLTDAQLSELTSMIRTVEALYDMPVEIEWAYAGRKLHVLQARPITTYVPLPPEMITPPGERRQLYADASLSKGLTTNKPISPLGLDFMEGMFTAILESWVGPMRRDVAPEDALFFFAGGRMYMNYSNLMWVASPERMAMSSAPTDVLMAEILSSIDPGEYRATRRPQWAGFRLVWGIPRILWSLRGFIWNLLRAALSPERAHQAYRQTVDAVEKDLREAMDKDVPIDELRREFGDRMAREVFDTVMPAVVVGMLSPDLVVRRKTDEERTIADKLRRGVTGNVVIEMGIALHRLSGLLERSEFEDLAQLIGRVENRLLAPKFLSAWDDFLVRFGCRGPLEMDLASPRYADDPGLALRQMSGMAVEGGFDPGAVHRRHILERQHAYEKAMRGSGLLRRALLRRFRRLGDLFAGSRDAPKHLLVLANYVVRRRALMEGRRLTMQGRLDAPKQVFDLTFEDLKAAAGDDSLDLRKICEQRTGFRKKLHAHVSSFPPVIDSRGRILRPPPIGDAPGLLQGMAVSPGKVTGRVRILHSHDEKRVEKGDVLVAYTTDPGWTPLFVNAAAIVLEVGGVLQHGAVVAREFGKPCVVGIDRIVAKLRDGQRVEVDGASGTVRVLREVRK